MILVTGATGFIGRALLPRLTESGAAVRAMIRPSKLTPALPRGIPVQVAISDINDPRGVRAALSGVDTVIHLASAEWRGRSQSLMSVDHQGTRALLEAARDAGVERIVYLSHLGADRASAYELHKVKGLVEEFVRKSGLNYLIIRSALAFGPEDAFTNALAMLMHISPGLFMIPGDGRTLLQPIWIDDLVTCIEWGLDDAALRNTTIEIGGPEFIPLDLLVKTIMSKVGKLRQVVNMPRPYLRWGAGVLQRVLPRSPITPYWMDHLAVNRTCELQSIPRYFSLRPNRFETNLGYLRRRKWGQELRYFISRTPGREHEEPDGRP